MNKITFKGKSSGIWVFGQLVYLDGSPFIVGDLVEANEEYASLEWWYPVRKDSVSRHYGPQKIRSWEDEMEYIKNRKDWAGLLEDILDELIESSNSNGDSLEFTSAKAFRLRDLLEQEGQK